MSNNKHKNRKGIVYSTNPDFEYDYDETEDVETLPANKQNLKVYKDSKQRKGKTVTIISGFVGNEEDIKALSKKIKNKCGVGGSVKNKEIIIQGDFADKIIEFLSQLQYNTKKAGG